MNKWKHLKNKTKTLEKITVYLGTEISPRSDFSGLQRTVMTELRPWSQDAVACLDLKENKDIVRSQTQQKKH